MSLGASSADSNPIVLSARRLLRLKTGNLSQRCRAEGFRMIVSRSTSLSFNYHNVIF